MKQTNNNAHKYLLVLWLSISLILTQYYGVHLHVEHDHHTSTKSTHVVEVQTVPTFHLLDDSTHNSFVAHHHTIDLSLDTLVKTKAAGDLLFVAVLVIFSWAFVLPVLQIFIRRCSYQLSCISQYNLIHPPLRAPPVH